MKKIRQQNWQPFKIPKMKLAKLELRRGDTLVAKTDHILTRPQCEELLARLKPYVPKGCKLMLLTSGLKLEVLVSDTSGAKP